MDQITLLAVLVGVAASGAAYVVLYDESEKIQRNTGRKGRAMMEEMLQQNHPSRVRDFLRMSKEVFLALCFILSVHGIHATKHMSVEEQVAIFLYICGNNVNTRKTMEQFQRSGDTISRYACLRACCQTRSVTFLVLFFAGSRDVFCRVCGVCC
jgi:hypothetical protein